MYLRRFNHHSLLHSPTIHSTTIPFPFPFKCPFPSIFQDISGDWKLMPSRGSRPHLPRRDAAAGCQAPGTRGAAHHHKEPTSFWCAGRRGDDAPRPRRPDVRHQTSTRSERVTGATCIGSADTLRPPASSVRTSRPRSRRHSAQCAMRARTRRSTAAPLGAIHQEMTRLQDAGQWRSCAAATCGAPCHWLRPA